MDRFWRPASTKPNDAKKRNSFGGVRQYRERDEKPGRRGVFRILKRTARVGRFHFLFRCFGSRFRGKGIVRPVRTVDRFRLFRVTSLGTERRVRPVFPSLVDRQKRLEEKRTVRLEPVFFFVFSFRSSNQPASSKSRNRIFVACDTAAKTSVAPVPRKAVCFFFLSAFEGKGERKGDRKKTWLMLHRKKRTSALSLVCEGSFSWSWALTKRSGTHRRKLPPSAGGVQ